MIAALYARKSTDQSGVSVDQKSITRQVEQARAYAHRKGWTVDERFVYVDDNVSGAEFANRPGFLRLMNSLKPRAPFQVLVMSEESRLGREAIETAYALKQLVTAGVRIFFYLEDRERTLDSPTDKIMLSLTTFADELEREKARQRTYDAMHRKAQAGHVTGGRVFGYRNVRVTGPEGVRGHVRREIDPDEAAIVRRIFLWSAQGRGYAAIAKILNAERAPSPRAQQGRPNGWTSSTILAVLRRDLYRGVVVWNKTRKRNKWGLRTFAKRPAAEWLTMIVPTLRIVSEIDWQAVRARQQQNPAAGGRPTRLSQRESRFLLTGLLRCAWCGSTLQVVWRGNAKTRLYRYGCAAHAGRGGTVCQNNVELDLSSTDRAVIDALLTSVLTEDVLDQLAIPRPRADRQAEMAELRRQARGLDREIRNLTDAITEADTPIAALVRRLQEKETARVALDLSLRDLEAPSLGVAAAKRVRAKGRALLAEWRTWLDAYPEDVRPILKTLLGQPIQVTPKPGTGSRRGATFAGVSDVTGVFRGEILSTLLASPAGLTRCRRPFSGVAS